MASVLVDPTPNYQEAATEYINQPKEEDPVPANVQTILKQDPQSTPEEEILYWSKPNSQRGLTNIHFAFTVLLSSFLFAAFILPFPLYLVIFAFPACICAYVARHEFFGYCVVTNRRACFVLPRHLLFFKPVVLKSLFFEPTFSLIVNQMLPSTPYLARVVGNKLVNWKHIGNVYFTSPGAPVNFKYAPNIDRLKAVLVQIADDLNRKTEYLPEWEVEVKFAPQENGKKRYYILLVVVVLIGFGFLGTMSVALSGIFFGFARILRKEVQENIFDKIKELVVGLVLSGILAGSIFYLVTIYIMQYIEEYEGIIENRITLIGNTVVPHVLPPSTINLR